MPLVEFTPLSLSPLLWLDSSAVNCLYQSGTRSSPGPAATTNGNSIGLWLDLSGNNNDLTQTNAPNKPTFQTGAFAMPSNGNLGSLAAPLFTATSSLPQYLYSGSSFLNSTFNTSMTVFIVKQDSTLTLSPSVLWSDTGATTYFRSDNLPSLHAALGTTNSNSGATNTKLAIEHMRWDGTHVDISMNGIRGARTANTGTLGFSSDNIVLGGYGNNQTGNYGYQGNIAEFIIYNTVLTDAQVGQVYAYLSNKWNIAVPSGIQVMCEGNSLTFGFYPLAPSTRLPGADYPSQLSQYLTINSAYPTVINDGSSGTPTNSLIYYANNTGAFSFSYLTAKFKTSFTSNLLLFWEITNDLYTASNGTYTGGVGDNPVAAYNNVVSYCQSRISEGYKVVLFTCLPRLVGSANANQEVDRLEVNAAIRATWKSGGTYVGTFGTYTCSGPMANALADVGGDPIIGATGAYTNTTYYIDGQTHLTPLGYQIVSNYAYNAIISSNLISTIGSKASAVGEIGSLV